MNLHHLLALSLGVGEDSIENAEDGRLEKQR